MKQSPVTTSRRSFVQRLTAAVAVLMAKPAASVTAAPLPPFGMSETFCRTFAQLSPYTQSVVVQATWAIHEVNTPPPHPEMPADLFTPPQLAAKKRRDAAGALS